MPADAGASSPVPEAGAVQQFLRGIGKRAIVLAQAQCGDSERAQQALQATLIEFRARAHNQPLAHWPEQFWQLLLAQPGLRGYHVVADADGRDLLACLSGGPRAALLLRMVAGLDATQAAAVLRVSPQSIRVAMQRALQALHADGVDEPTLHALRERLQQRVRSIVDPLQPVVAAPTRAFQLPAKPTANAVSQNRTHPQPIPVTGTPRTPSRPIAVQALSPRRRRLRWALIGLLGVLLLALIATFYWPRPRLTDAVLVDRLPEQPVALRLDAVSAALANPDFDLLNDPAGERDAHELALLSWFDAASSSDAASEQPAVLPESAAPETSTPDPEEPQEGGSPHAP